MKESLVQTLIEGCPNLLKHCLSASNPHPLPPKPNCLSERGIEISDGWYELLRSSLFQAEAVAQDLDEEVKAQFYITQIKSKFNVLRVYISHIEIAHTPETIDKLNLICKIIEKAEVESELVCEICGTPGCAPREHSTI